MPYRSRCFPLRPRFFVRPWLLLGLLAFGLGGCVVGCRSGVSSQAIINGTPDARHPAVGVLVRSGVPFCTATLIAPRVVLTAGHCADIARAAEIGGAKVAFRIDQPDPAMPRGFRSDFFPTVPHAWETHPGWNSPAQDNDFGIGLLQNEVPPTLATPIPFNDRPLETLPLPATALFLGYGLIVSVPHPLSPDEKYGADLPVRLQGPLVISGDARKSICHGDSGGPALLSIDGQIRVIAVNAFGLNSGFVPGSSPSRLICNGQGASYRTDLIADYLRDRLSRAHTAGASCSPAQGCGPCGTCSVDACVPRSSPPPASLCAACQNDADCGPSALCYAFPQGRRCIPSCDPSGCCPTQTSCVSFRRGGATLAACLPWDGLCSKACQNDAGCDASEVCTQEVCSQKSPVLPGRLCWPCQTDGACDQGGLCLGKRDNKGVCGISCETTGRCPEGFVCRRLASGIEAQCVPSPTKDGRDGACMISCQGAPPSPSPSSCPAGWLCTQGRCLRPQGQEEGEACGPIPCKADLVCAPAVEGFRCLRPCRMKAGETGAACGPSDSCNDPKALCLPMRGLKRRFCFARCQGAQDCPFGGVCTGGSCFCSDTSECRPGSFCEKSLGSSSGFCVPQARQIACPQGQICRHELAGSFCVAASLRGERLQGQACDELSACRTPLTCVEFARQIGHCTRRCSQDGDCQGQGRCQDGHCFCEIDEDCGADQRCIRIEPSGRNSLWGLCVPTPDRGSCSTSVDCLPSMLCTQGRCISLTDERPPSEAVEEPSTDSEIPHDSGSSEEESKNEGREPRSDLPTENEDSDPPAEAPRNSEAPTPKEGSGPFTEPSKRPETRVSGGCACSAAPVEPTLGLLVLLWGLFQLTTRRKNDDF